MGLAFASWGNDHGGQRPFQVPWELGGTLPPSVRPGNAWEEHRILSSHLASPAVFACPSDPLVRPALYRNTSVSGGFYNPSYQNNAVSYFIGLDASASFTDSILGGDRDLRVVNPSGGCLASRVNNAAVLDQRSSFATVLAWTNALHQASGNILFNDGRVATLSTPELRVATSRTLNDEGQCHILLPR